MTEHKKLTFIIVLQHLHISALYLLVFFLHLFFHPSTKTQLQFESFAFHRQSAQQNIDIVLKCSPLIPPSSPSVATMPKIRLFQKTYQVFFRKNDFSLFRAFFFNIIIVEALNKCIHNGLGTVVFL